ncbi:MAG TPA: YbhB/YbcL family Raf kinase inhibitor-like protein [Gammaproteobacteria bacterium]
MRSLVSSLLLGSALVFQGSASAADAFTITTPAFKDGGTIAMEQVFNSFGCTGGNHSPELSWSGAPAGTKSFAVTIYDPDAPTGSGFWHWTVFNIPASVTHIPADAGGEKGAGLPAGAIQGRTDFGFSHFGGPCPPVGDAPHHYHVTVYALKTDKLPLDAMAPGALVGFYIHMNTLGKATVTGMFGRSK